MSSDARPLADRARPLPRGAIVDRKASDDDVKGTLRLEGQVVDVEQRPVGGARVRLSPGDKFTTSEADGSFAFEQLAARRYRVSAGLDDRYAGPVTVRLVDATTEPVILRMRQGATLIVRVIANRAPVAGAKLVMGNDTTVLTDADGVAKVLGLGPGNHEGQVIADGWAPENIYPSVGEDPGGVIEWTVRLQHGASVDGIVLGPADKPVPNAKVVLWDAAAFFWIAETTTDETGAWHIDTLQAGTYSLVASSKTHGPTPYVTVEFDGRTPRRDIVVRVEVGGQLGGTVVDGAGKPVTDAFVVAVLRGESTYDARTDANGKFELLGLKVGTYDVSARRAGQASPSVRIALANNKPEDVRLVIQDSRIAGTVVDTNGEPVAEVRVTANAVARYSTTSGIDVVTDSQGHFDLGGLEPGEYTVSVRASDRRSGEGTWQRALTGETSVKIVLPSPAILTGRVVLDGKPMSYYGLLLLDQHSFPGNGSTPTGIRAVDGRFTLRGVDPATHGISVLGPGTALKMITGLKVVGGATIDLGDIAMDRGQRVAGHVRDAAGSPVAGARVAISRGNFGNSQRLEQWFGGDFETTTDAAGAYMFEGVAAHGRGMTLPKISATHFARGASLLRDLREGDATIDLVLIGTGSIEGFVEGFRDRAFVNALRSDEPARARYGVVNRAGKFQFDEVPAGDYTISVETSRGQTVSEASITVVAGQRTKVKLVSHSSTVKLTVKVPWGSSEKLVLAPFGEGVPDSVTEPDLVLDDKVIFQHVDPGKYRVSNDGKTWMPIVVAASPAEQSVEIGTGTP